MHTVGYCDLLNPPVGGWSGRNDRLTGGCGEVWDVWANPLAADNKQGRLFYRARKTKNLHEQTKKRELESLDNMDRGVY